MKTVNLVAEKNEQIIIGGQEMIYKYRKITDQYTTYTLIQPEDKGLELATIDDWTYVLIPDDSILPVQPAQVQETIESVAVTPELNIQLKIACPSIVHQLTKINQAVNTYIYNYYDPGTQDSFNGLQARRSTPDAVKDIIDSVYDWIQTIMEYYYTKKANIIMLDEPGLVTWDFSQFDATKPDVLLSDLVS